MNLADFIAEAPDFPKPGIIFKDITPLLLDPAAFDTAITRLQERAEGRGATHVAGIESRGFIFGTPLARAMMLPFIPIRKPGKLPRATISESYDLEYGTDAIEMHTDALAPGDRVILIDDLLATGGTMAAAAHLVEKAGATVAGIQVVVELCFLNGRDKLAGYDLASLIEL